MNTRETELLLIDLFFDLCILNLTILVTGWLSPSISLSLWNYHVIADYFMQANLACVLSYIFFSKKNLFLRDGFKSRFKRITRRTIGFLLISGLIGFLLMPTGYQKSFLIEFTLVFYASKLIFYWGLYHLMLISRHKDFHTDRTIIMGTNETCHHIRKLIDNNPLLGYKFVGYVSDEITEDQEVLGHPDNLPGLIDKYKLQMVFVPLSLFGESVKGKEYLRICTKKGIRMSFIPENQRWNKSHINSDSVESMEVVNPQEIPLDDVYARLFKRSFDLLFSLFLIIVVFSWLFPILAIVIKLSSKGPVFFVQKRTGINNKIFNCLKFRSMKVNDQADTKQATCNDVRITRIGKFLRCSNMDELPQFINVLLGDMSVSGPRPHMLKHTDQYAQLIDQYMVRQYVKPGITGWAQVNGYRGETDELWKMEQRVKHDIEYLENWNFWWDLKIIFNTVLNKRCFGNAWQHIAGSQKKPEIDHEWELKERSCN